MTGKRTRVLAMQGIIDRRKPVQSVKEICNIKGLNQRNVYDLIARFKNIDMRNTFIFFITLHF